MRSPLDPPVQGVLQGEGRHPPPHQRHLRAPGQGVHSLQGSGRIAPECLQDDFVTDPEILKIFGSQRGSGVLRKGQHSWNISVTKEARVDPKVVLE